MRGTCTIIKQLFKVGLQGSNHETIPFAQDRGGEVYFCMFCKYFQFVLTYLNVYFECPEHTRLEKST